MISISTSSIVIDAKPIRKFSVDILVEEIIVEIESGSAMEAVDLSHRFRSQDGAALVFAAEGLPEGLSLSPDGMLSGTATTGPAETMATVVATTAGGLSISEPLRVIVAAAPPVVSAPTLSGEQVVGGSLSASASVSGSDPISLSFQWLRDGAPIPGATGADYSPTASDDGARLSVVATASNVAGVDSATSDAVIVAFRAPVVLSASISGAPEVGGVLTAAASLGGGAAEPAFQWTSDGVAIPGATASFYTLTPADDRTAVGVTALAANSGGVDSAAAPAVMVAYKAPSTNATLADVEIVENDGAATRAAAAVFADAIGGAWSVTVDGREQPDIASIDDRGLVTLHDTTPVAGAEVAVAYANSGGSASVAFELTVTLGRGAPSAFDDGDWELATRVGFDRQFLVTLARLPNDNGAPLTGIEYTIDDGATWTAVPGSLSLGTRSLDVPDDGSATLRLRAVNAVGASAASGPKTAVAGVGPNLITADYLANKGWTAGSGDWRSAAGATINTAAGGGSVSVKVDAPAGTYRLRAQITATGPGSKDLGLNGAREVDINAQFISGVYEGANPFTAATRLTVDKEVTITAGADEANWFGIVAFDGSGGELELTVRNFVLTPVPGAVIPAPETVLVPDAGPVTLRAAAGATETVSLGKAVSRVALQLPIAPVQTFSATHAGLDVAAGSATIVRVTSLADTGAGTLRAALATAGTDPIVIVFDVAGKIALASDLGCWRPNVWIAGQTAPGPVVIHGFPLVIRAGNVRVEHLHFIKRAPGSVSESGGGDCLSITANNWTGDLRDITVSHCSFVGATDEAVQVFATGKEGQPSATIDNVIFFGCVFTHPQRRTGALGNFHKAGHNYGPVVGGACGAAFVECAFAGFADRSPRIVRGSRGALVNGFIHDFKASGTNIPIQLASDTHFNLFGIDVSAIACQFETGEQGTVLQGFSTQNGGGTATAQNPCYVYDADCYFEPGRTGTVATIGADGRAAARSTSGSGDFVWLTAPRVWSVVHPTHHDDIRGRALDAGARPSDRPAYLTTLLNAVAAQRAKSPTARDPLYYDSNVGQTPPNPTITTVTQAWAAPASPFAAASSGLTNIEEALETASAALGGARTGNVGRPLWVPGGGKLEVTPAGAVTWTAAPTAHGPVAATVTMGDGEQRHVFLETT